MAKKAKKKAGQTTNRKQTARRKVAARAAATRKGRRQSKAKPTLTTRAAATVKGALAGAVAAVTKRLPGDTDIIALLEADHRRMEELFKQGEDTTARAVKGRTALLNTLTTELNLHELVEETLLYPALKAHPESRDIVLEGIQEHHVADVIVKELHALARNAEAWGAKFKVLQENIAHHIQEEEGSMFRTARGVLSRDELQAMGAQMKKMKGAKTPKN